MPVDTNRMGNEFIFDDERFLNDNEINSGIKFVSLGPRVFQNLRRLHSLDENDIINLFSVSNLLKGKLRVKLQSGKGGAFFLFPENGNYLIKSINSQEYQVMKEILPDFYMHYLKYPSSFINPIYGCYALYLSESNEIEPQYFILMKNVLDINKTSLPSKSEMLCFDIKGSSAGRQTLKDPKVLLLGNINEDIQKLTLKDADFLMSFKTLDVTPLQGQSILNQLENDAMFLSKYLLIDYSLLLYVINVPYRTYISNRSGITHKSDKAKGMHAQELILAERNTEKGRPEIIIEEREKITNKIYRITNSNDIEIIRKIDDAFAEQREFSDSDSFINLEEQSFDDNRVKETKPKSSKLEIPNKPIINFPKVISKTNIAKYSITGDNEGLHRHFETQKIIEDEKINDSLLDDNEIINKKIIERKESNLEIPKDLIKVSDSNENLENNMDKNFTNYRPDEYVIYLI